MKNPAKLTLRNIYAVIQSWFRKVRHLAGWDLPKHLYEQVIWRRTQVMVISPECWYTGHCIECGCEVLGKTMEDRKCDGACYPDMMSKENWEAYKRINNIKLFE